MRLHDEVGGGPAHGVGHDQKLHQVVVNGTTGGLYQKYVRAAHRFIHGHGALAVGEMGAYGVAKGDVQVVAYALRQLGIGISGEHLDFFPVRDHSVTPYPYGRFRFYM